MISSRIGHSFDPVILSIYRFIFRHRILNPNILTVWGLIFALLCAVSIALEHLVAGAALLIVSAFLDLSDGAIARNTGRVTRFGGFLDSVLDRYADLAVMLGIFIHFQRQGALFYSIVTFVASIGVALVPYARARAEAASLSCKTGLLERPERILLILIGLFLPVLPYAIAILAIATHVTVIQRIIFVRKEANNEK